MSMPAPFNLQAWIRKNKHLLQPPVSNKQLYVDEAQDVIVFISGGPNTRNDYHVNPTEELFYQLKGNIAVRVRPLDGSAPHDVVIKEGEMFLLPRWVPHRPQRPANTVGLIVEFPRGEDAEGAPQKDGLRWYCPQCDALVHEATWVLRKIDEDLKIIMEDFWGGPEDRRTCKECGHVIQRAGAIAIERGKVKSAPKAIKKAAAGKAKKAPAKAARGKATKKAARGSAKKAGRGR